MKAVFFGFDLFHDCLELMLSSGCEIMKIFTCGVDGDYEFNDKTYGTAALHGIPITELRPTERELCMLRDAGCELAVSAGYYYKIPVTDGLVQVNIHPSLLPEGRGPWPQPVALLKKKTRFGVTIHRLSSELDAGDILLQSDFEMAPDENLETLTQKTVTLGTKLLGQLICAPDGLLDRARPQIGGEYWPEPTACEMSFRVTDGFEKIDLVTRAFYGYVCYMHDGARRVAIRRAVCVKDGVDFKKDYVLSININGGRLIILKLA